MSQILALIFAFSFTAIAQTKLKTSKPKPPVVKSTTTTSSTSTTTSTTLPANETLSVEPDTTQTPMATEPALVEPPKKTKTGMNRGLSKWTGNLHLSPLSTWVPLKHGLSLGYVTDPQWTIETEYTRSSFAAGLFGVDLGRITDSRYGLQARFYPGNASFNLMMGLYRNDIAFELGNNLLNRIPNIPSGTVFRVRSIGPQIGLSNRWQWQSGFTFGMDWFTMYYPMFDKVADDTMIAAASNQSDQDDLNGVVKFFRDKPEFDLFKFTIGYTF